jgi:hypothetical protein
LSTANTGYFAIVGQGRCDHAVCVMMDCHDKVELSGREAHNDRGNMEEQ